MRRLYATDSSEYQELPLAVAFPADETDVRELIRFAAAAGIGLIPRTAGTSLAGQCVGSGIVVDVSEKFFPWKPRAAASACNPAWCGMNSTTL